MLKDRRNNSAKTSNYPKQAHIPSPDQLRDIYQTSVKRAGTVTELPFGDNFVLACCRKPNSSGCEWTLYRREDGHSLPEWQYVSTDPRWIYQQITSSIPNWNPTRSYSGGKSANDGWMPSPETDNDDEREPIMEGELGNVGLPSLLGSIARDSFTGKLEIRSSGRVGIIYVNEGKAVHCTLSKYQGREALQMVVAMGEGKFRFFTTRPIDKVTLPKDIGWILQSAPPPPGQSKRPPSKTVGTFPAMGVAKDATADAKDGTDQVPSMRHPLYEDEKPSLLVREIAEESRSDGAPNTLPEEEDDVDIESDMLPSRKPATAPEPSSSSQPEQESKQHPKQDAGTTAEHNIHAEARVEDSKSEEPKSPSVSKSPTQDRLERLRTAPNPFSQTANRRREPSVHNQPRAEKPAETQESTETVKSGSHSSFPTAEIEIPQPIAQTPPQMQPPEMPPPPPPLAKPWETSPRRKMQQSQMQQAQADEQPAAPQVPDNSVEPPAVVPPANPWGQAASTTQPVPNASWGQPLPQSQPVSLPPDAMPPHAAPASADTVGTNTGAVETPQVPQPSQPKETASQLSEGQPEGRQRSRLLNMIPHQPGKPLPVDMPAPPPPQNAGAANPTEASTPSSAAPQGNSPSIDDEDDPFDVLEAEFDPAAAAKLEQRKTDPRRKAFNPFNNLGHHTSENPTVDAQPEHGNTLPAPPTPPKAEIPTRPAVNVVASAFMELAQKGEIVPPPVPPVQPTVPFSSTASIPAEPALPSMPAPNPVPSPPLNGLFSTPPTAPHSISKRATSPSGPEPHTNSQTNPAWGQPGTSQPPSAPPPAPPPTKIPFSRLTNETEPPPADWLRIDEPGEVTAKLPVEDSAGVQPSQNTPSASKIENPDTTSGAHAHFYPTSPSAGSSAQPAWETPMIQATPSRLGSARMWQTPPDQAEYESAAAIDDAAEEKKDPTVETGETITYAPPPPPETQSSDNPAMMWMDPQTAPIGKPGANLAGWMAKNMTPPKSGMTASGTSPAFETTSAQNQAVVNEPAPPPLPTTVSQQSPTLAPPQPPSSPAPNAPNNPMLPPQPSAPPAVPPQMTQPVAPSNPGTPVGGPTASAERKARWPSEEVEIFRTPEVPGYSKKDRFQVRMTLVNRETQILQYPVLMYFTEMEFVRAARYNRSFSLIVVQVGTAPATPNGLMVDPLTPDGMALLGTKIMDIKRSPDLLGHFDPAGLAILMPETERKSADKLALRIATMISLIEPCEWTRWKPLRYLIGYAGAPDNAVTLPQLVNECVKYQMHNVSSD